MRITHHGRPLAYHVIPARPESGAEPPKAQFLGVRSRRPGRIRGANGGGRHTTHLRPFHTSALSTVA